MALATYLAQTRRLIQNPSAPVPLYSDSDLTADINIARNQIAGEGECIRYEASLALAATTQVYSFSAISIATASISGIQSVLNVRTAWRVSGSGRLWMQPQPFEWFSLYNLNAATPATGAPTEWAQFGQGELGSLYLSPVPSTTATLLLDTVCVPIALVDDSTVEAIPALWTDAIQYFAAYLALLSAQTSTRNAEAERMFKLYEMFMNRARTYANPSVIPSQYPQSQQPTRIHQLGLAPSRPQAAEAG